VSLERELLALFARGVDAPLPEAEFERLALAVFAYQYERNAPYSAVCRLRGVTPADVAGWRDIPALMTDAFKVADLTTVASGTARVTFLTSGTTGSETRRGRHLLPNTRLYDASLEPTFRAHVLPDRDRIRMLICGPTAEHFPHSSLGHMLSRVRRRLGAPGSGVFWRPDGPRFSQLAAALHRAERDGVPVCLLGTAFAFVHFLDWLIAHERAYRLPRGSRLMDTGGYKGRSREVPPAELRALYDDRLGIPPSRVVNEYGMTELGSQFYDSALRTRIGPPWARALVVHPETLREVPDGEVGLLRFVDLANLHTVVSVQTDDLGRRRGDRFELLGRVPGAEPRGCSLPFESLPGGRP